VKEKRMKGAAWSALACLVLGPTLAAENWPQWRGPLGTGVSPEKDLPARWAPDTVAWKTALGGSGVSSPVVWGERVFVTSQRGRGQRKEGSHPRLARDEPAAAAAEKALRTADEGEAGTVFVVEAFHRSDGRRLWEHRLAAEGELSPVHEKHNLASPSAVTDGERVYAWFGTGQVVALTMEGKPVWQRHLGKEIGPFHINWGHGSSPALHGDLLFLLCYHEPASYLLAVDKATGKTRWKTDRGKDIRSYSTPVVVPGPSGDELVVNSTEGIHAYEPATGKLLWHVGGTHNFGIPVPSFQDGVIYASRGYRSGPYMALRPGGRGDVTATHVKWQVPTGAPYISSLLPYQGLVYMASDSGVVTCLDAASGAKVWQERTGGIFSASPVAGDGKVYFASETGEVLVFQAGREPRLLERNRVEGRLVASPAIAEGRIYLRTDDSLIAIGRAR
jgi:outer membrane protein assembly factor BamB